MHTDNQRRFPILRPVQPIDAAAAYDAIKDLDLSLVGRTVLPPDRAPLWTPAEAERIEALYRNFLRLAATYPGRTLVPTSEVAAFWRRHILHTRQYVEDCSRIFGRYLHHVPETTADGSRNAIARAQAFMASQTLWDREFGDR
jgi:hypothetical protein